MLQGQQRGFESCRGQGAKPVTEVGRLREEAHIIGWTLFSIDSSYNHTLKFLQHLPVDKEKLNSLQIENAITFIIKWTPA